MARKEGGDCFAFKADVAREASLAAMIGTALPVNGGGALRGAQHA